ncbi:unnamed protein product [Rhizoctonia solani]|uniref:O-methylsterigmatocystin oxidoreductase n=1 Tax=Rhizoctonia solani TaxID=456999 RepID=A0A8H2WVQ3_9AGAM|nr:unnamed protein product [Rhizoctonia solani]
MGLVEHKAYQKRAREEIDCLYNEETLPRRDDEQKMPFVRAVVKEALRWRTPLPMGVPHRNEPGDYYGGYLFPAGSTVVCNTAAIHMNPAKYDNPERFNPDRFLGHTLSMAESAVQSDPLKLLVLGSYWDWPGSRRKDMPPGPGPTPILGNLLQLKPAVFYDQIRELNQKYGPLASLKMGSNNVILIGGDGSLVRELLDKRGSIYSNRPTEPMLKIASSGDHLLFQQDTEKWRAARKQIVRHYPRASDPEHVRLQEAESVQLLHDFLHDPERNMQHSMRYTTSIITCLNYGVRCATYKDPIIHGIEAIMTPRPRPPVEHFPYLPDFMVGNWKARTQHLKELMEKIYGGKCLVCLAEIGWERGSAGLNTDNFSYKLRLNEGATKLTRNHQAQVCGIALEGGSDIVAGVISTAILAYFNKVTR